MLLIALRLRRKGATLFCYFGGDPGSVLNRQLAAEGLLKAAPAGGREGVCVVNLGVGWLGVVLVGVAKR